MDEGLQDDIESAIETGTQNLQILELAAAWCRNVARDKGPLGTGLIEADSGLPVSGGTLRCEHAEPPRMFAHVLAPGALDFYERNCIGCRHRQPTPATEHLGTWGDRLISARKAREAEAAAAGQRRESARRARREHRRFHFGAPKPDGQSILDLIDRVDAETPDVDAACLLVRHAEMSPGDFSDPLVEHLASEALSISSDALLRAVIAIFEREGRPATERMLCVAFDGLAAGVAPTACSTVIAAYANEFRVDDRAFRAIVDVAAGREDHFSRRTGGEPAALLRFFDVSPERVVALLAALLRGTDVHARGAAAYAAERLVGARAAARIQLLPALLDAAALPDKSRYAGHPFAASQARTVIAEILLAEPAAASNSLDERMQGAAARLARKLWGCYDRAVRSHLGEQLPVALCVTIEKRAVDLLARDDMDVELQREVADTLSLLGKYHGEAMTTPVSDLAALLLHAVVRADGLEGDVPESLRPKSPAKALEAALARHTAHSSACVIQREIGSVIEGRVLRDPSDYIALVTGGFWVASEQSERGRSALLDVLGKVVRSQADLDRVSPMLLAAINGGRTAERGAALRAAAEIGQGTLRLPEALIASFVNALNSEYLYVVRNAIRAVAVVAVSDAAAAPVLNCLLSFAASYGPKRIYQELPIALQAALRVAHGRPYQNHVEEFILDLLCRFPSSVSAEILLDLEIDHGRPRWAEAAMAALHPDADRVWSGVHDRDRIEILRELGHLSTEQVQAIVGELAKIATERLPHDPSWAWAVCDVLSRHGFDGHAATVCDAVVEAIPDTREDRFRRSYARQIALGRHVEAAVARCDDATANGLLAEWSALAKADN